MDKPLSLMIEETKQSLVNTINTSQLHPFILDSIVKDLYNEIHILCMNQTKQEIDSYNAEMAKNAQDKKEEDTDEKQAKDRI